MSWRAGYVADVPYASGVYLETAPAHLALCALLAGVRPPDPAQPFRYLELGCGTGLGLCLLAAANPQGAFVGVDFNPSHVASAEALIAAAGLENVTVREASFADLAGEAPSPAERFHFTSAHGVWTWVSRAVQHDLVRALERQVRPGGLVYLGYNNMAGWASTLSLQQLMFDHAARVSGDSIAKIKAAAAFALSLRDAQPRGLDFSRLELTVGVHAEALENAPPGLFAYMAHEYLNEAWRPVFPSEVARDLADAKLAYAGSANPFSMMPELLLTQSELPALDAYGDAPGRRSLADHLGPQPFRQDVFARGAVPLHPDSRARALEAVQLALIQPASDLSMKIGVPSGQLQLDADTYAPLHVRLGEGAATVAELRELALGQGHEISAQELVTVLVGSGAAAPVARPGAEDSAADRARSARFNVAMMHMLRDQAGMRLALASARLGSGAKASLKSCLGYLSLVTPDDPAAALQDPVIREEGARLEPFWRQLGAM